MLYQPVLNEFWQHLQQSILAKTFVKLTLAKTIGDTELKNCYMRPVILENKLQFAWLERYKTQETEQFYSLEEVQFKINQQINNPFLSALLFTTTADINFKLNKKRAGSLTEHPPTFKKPPEIWQ